LVSGSHPVGAAGCGRDDPAESPGPQWVGWPALDGVLSFASQHHQLKRARRSTLACDFARLVKCQDASPHIAQDRGQFPPPLCHAAASPARRRGLCPN
jgi:hypothetical protein